jgi:hypothetical protein
LAGKKVLVIFAIDKKAPAEPIPIRKRARINTCQFEVSANSNIEILVSNRHAIITFFTGILSSKTPMGI